MKPKTVSVGWLTLETLYLLMSSTSQQLQVSKQIKQSIGLQSTSEVLFAVIASYISSEFTYEMRVFVVKWRRTEVTIVIILISFI